MTAITNYTEKYAHLSVSIEYGFIDSLGYASTISYCAELYEKSNGCKPNLIELNEQTNFKMILDLKKNFSDNRLFCFDMNGTFSYDTDDSNLIVQEFIFNKTSLVIKINNKLDYGSFVLSESKSTRENITNAHLSCTDTWLTCYHKTYPECDIEKHFSDALGTRKFLYKPIPSIYDLTDNTQVSSDDFYDEDDCEIECYKLPDWTSIPDVIIKGIDDFYLRNKKYPNVIMFEDYDEDAFEQLVNIGVLGSHFYNGYNLKSDLFSDSHVKIEFYNNKPFIVYVNDEKLFSISKVSGSIGALDEFALIYDKNYEDENDDDLSDNKNNPVLSPVVEGDNDWDFI